VEKNFFKSKGTSMRSAQWLSFWGRKRENAVVQRAWVWVLISEAGQANKT
jgi:hypothetical protein